jgi:hypothetical protein
VVEGESGPGGIDNSLVLSALPVQVELRYKQGLHRRLIIGLRGRMDVRLKMRKQEDCICFCKESL